MSKTRLIQVQKNSRDTPALNGETTSSEYDGSRWKLVTVHPQQIYIPQERLSAVQSESSLTALRETYRMFGMLSEPGVYKGWHGYTLAYGQSRLEEALRQGIKQLRVKLWNVDEDEAILLEFAENYARGTVNVVNLAERIQTLLERGKYKAKDIAKLFNTSEQTISKIRMIRDLPRNIKGHLHSGQLSFEHGVELHKIQNRSLQEKVTKMAVRHSWTTAQLRSHINHAVLEKCDHCGKMPRRLMKLDGRWLCPTCMKEFHPGKWRQTEIAQLSVTKAQSNQVMEAAKVRKAGACEICRKNNPAKTSRIHICNEDLNRLEALLKRLYAETGRRLHELNCREIAALSISLKNKELKPSTS